MFLDQTIPILRNAKKATSTSNFKPPPSITKFVRKILKIIKSVTKVQIPLERCVIRERSLKTKEKYFRSESCHKTN